MRKVENWRCREGKEWTREVVGYMVGGRGLMESEGWKRWRTGGVGKGRNGRRKWCL